MHVKKIYPAYVSQGNWTVKNLMAPSGDGWHYIAVKILPAVLRRITSKHHGDSYFLNCFHTFRTKRKLKWHKKVCENKDFCNIAMSSEGIKISEFNQYQKSDKVTFSIYVHLECLIQQIDECKSNPENSSKKKVGEDIASGFSLSTKSSFECIEKKNDVYRGKRKFSEYLKEHAMEVNNQKNEVKQRNSKNHMKMQNFVLFVKKNLKINMLKIKKISKS